MSQGIEGAGLAGVGATGESHLVTLVVRTLFDLGCAEGEFGFLAEAEDGVLDLHGISEVGVAKAEAGKRCRFRLDGGSI